MTHAKEAIIQLNELTKKYGEQTAVDMLTLSIYRGEIFGLLGPNGAGKSTTILMMLGLAEPTHGQSIVCGIDSTRYSIQVKKRVGYLPDDVGFYEERTGLDNLLFTAYLNRIPPKEAKERALRLLDQVGLADAMEKTVGAYSRGMRQRLGLADVLIKDPEIIILDEPTLGIDPEGVREFLTLIRSLSREQGLTVLLSSHHLHQVQQICDRVGLFVQGKLIAKGDVRSLSNQLFEDEPIEVDVQIASANAELISSLEAIEDVMRIEHKDDGQLLMRCRRDCTGDIARTIVQHGATLLRLNQREFGLDEIYHRYFEGGDNLDQQSKRNTSEEGK